MDFDESNWEPHHIHDYHPHRIHGERNPRFDTVSRQLLDTKNPEERGYRAAVIRFSRDVADKLRELLRGGPCVCVVVPSSTAGRHSDGLAAILRNVADMVPNVTLEIDVLRRHTTIPKLATGGSREIAVHVNSIEISEPGRIAGRRILLLDDICTSCNSMEACRQLLLDAGAEEVIGLAIGRTTHA
jgi:predicted amidophosphoribosyltransferase